MEREIYFKQKPGKRRDIKSLLKQGFGNGMEFKPTFRNKECTISEFRMARRSFGDLLLICKTYFPNTTEKQLARALKDLNEKIGVRASYCGTINKVVFIKQTPKIKFNAGVPSYLRNMKGNGTHSYNEILKLAK